jgi:uncharacterized membrane protein YuzA (DUF378 family)
MKNGLKNYLKISLTFVACVLARLVPVRVPNIEPILGATMPISKTYGVYFAFSFPILSVLMYDLLTSTLGVQTFFTATTYGLVGMSSFFYFKNREANISNYVRFSVMATLFYDVATGFTVGPLIYHQSIIDAVVGQIPFTLLHLLGNIIFAILLSPALYKFFRKRKRQTENLSIIKVPNPQII